MNKPSLNENGAAVTHSGSAALLYPGFLFTVAVVFTGYAIFEWTAQFAHAVKSLRHCVPKQPPLRPVVLFPRQRANENNILDAVPRLSDCGKRFFQQIYHFISSSSAPKSTESPSACVSASQCSKLIGCRPFSRPLTVDKATPRSCATLVCVTPACSRAALYRAAVTGIALACKISPALLLSTRSHYSTQVPHASTVNTLICGGFKKCVSLTIFLLTTL